MTVNMHMIYQAVLMLGQLLNLVSGMVPAKYQPFVALGIGLIQAFLGWYAHHYNPDGTPSTVAYVAKVVLFCLLVSGIAKAQTAPTPSPLLSASTQAVAIRIGGQTVPGTDLVGSFNLTTNWLLETHNILAPSINFQRYTGGVKTYPAFLAKPLAKTSLSNVQPCIEADAGIVRNVPAVGSATQHYTFSVSGCFDYKVNDRLSLGPRAGWLNAPGFGPHPNGAIVSANLTLVLGIK
jgi:hypothetical protein